VPDDQGAFFGIDLAGAARPGQYWPV